jgi:hypothetical protein
VFDDAFEARTLNANLPCPLDEITMSLQALISLSRSPNKVDADRNVSKRLEQSRRQMEIYDREIETRIAAKAVTREQLAKTCSL